MGRVQPPTNRAVSQVVGMVLVISITVLLAGVVSGFAIGLFDDTPNAPTATFSLEYSAGELTISHETGEHVLPGTLHVRGDCVGCVEGVDQHWSNYTAAEVSGSIDGVPAVASGDSLTLTSVGADYDISVVWESTDGAASTTLGAQAGT